MRYFAILKDSFREALDSKVLYVMLVLSTLVILFVGTLSFKPVSAQKTMEMFFPDNELGGLSLMFLALNNQELKEFNDSNQKSKKREMDDDHILARMQRLSSYRLEKVELLNGEPDSPNSDYVLTITDIFPRLQKDDDAAAAKIGIERVREIFQRAEDFGLIRVGDITANAEPAGKNNLLGAKLQYRVSLHSTPETHRIWGASTHILFVFPLPGPAAPLGYQIYILSRVVILFGSWIAINVGVVITSFFIPNMLSKGTIDMMLVKPIDRWAILLYKYIGGLTFIFINAAFAIFGMWLVLGIRTGVWPNGCLILILTLTFFFAILYAISTYVSVVTRSSIASILLTILMWFLFFVIGWGQGKLNEVNQVEKMMERAGAAKAAEERWGDGYLASALNVLNSITPRTEDLNQLNDHIVYCDLLTGNPANMSKLNVSRQNWLESVFVAAVWIVVFLGIACTWFTYKTY